MLLIMTSEVVPWLVWDIYGRYHAHNCRIYVLYCRTYAFIFHTDLSCSLGDLSFFIMNDYDLIFTFPM